MTPTLDMPAPQLGVDSVRDSVEPRTVMGAPMLEARDDQPQDGLLRAGFVVASRYRLVTPIGAGATATVWQAFDTELERVVALKVFPMRQAGAVARRALSEARAVAAVVSDHVIRVHSACVCDALGVLAIDMELAREIAPDGGVRLAADLSREVERRRDVHGARGRLRPAEVRDAARWVMQAALGVDAAHRQNVFHRDLKPSNVLVLPETKRAQVLDFGLAAGLACEVDRATPILAGTPEYMAPEQARGMAALDPSKNAADRARLAAVDVYGLGALLFELLALEPPHRAAEGASLGEILAIASDNRIDARALRRRGAPRALVDIALRALASEPSARYARPAELALELERFLTSHPTTAEARRPARRLVLAARRSPRLTSSLLAMVVLAAVLVVGSLQVRAAERAVEQNRAAAAAAERERAAAESARREEESKRSDAEAERLRAESEARAERERRTQAESDRAETSAALEAQRLRASNDRARAAADKAAATTEQARLVATIAELEATLAELNATLAKEKLDHDADVAAERKQAESSIASLKRDQTRALEDERSRGAADLARVTAELEAAKTSVSQLEARVAELEAAARAPSSQPNPQPNQLPPMENPPPRPAEPPAEPPAVEQPPSQPPEVGEPAPPRPERVRRPRRRHR
ncbi:MAG: protein kinase [Polyangiaceae bacterium]